MAYTEADVRDSLASQLDQIEDGLEFVEKELELPNAVGARGFIDIFARDRFGNYVVVEVKRADQTARQALHEIVKYAELLQREHGIAAHKIRLIVASTHWHELAVPFSAFARISPYSLDGIELTVDDVGNVTAVARAPEVTPVIRGQLAEDNIVLLFRSQGPRDDAWDALAPHFASVGMDDVLGLDLDYEGGGERVVFPYGLAVVPGRISLDRAREVGLVGSDEVAPGIGPEDIAEGYDASDGPSLESEALGELFSNVRLGWDDAEAATPEKLAAEEQKGWNAVRVHRVGSFAAATYISDEELIQQTRGFEGLNSVVLDMTATPAIRSAWDELALRSQMILEGNDTWQSGLVAWLGEREQERPADLRVHIYHLQNIIRALVRLVNTGRPDYLDMLIAGVGTWEQPDRALGGMLVWDGGGLDVYEAAIRVFSDDPADFVFRWGIAAAELEQEMLALLNLRYVLVERVRGGEPSLYTPDGRRSPIPDGMGDSLRRFIETNVESIRRVEALIDAYSVGAFE